MCAQNTFPAAHSLASSKSDLRNAHFSFLLTTILTVYTVLRIEARHLHWM